MTVRARLEVRGGEVQPRLLEADYRYLNTAGELIALFQKHVGCTRGVLEDALQDYEGDRLDYPVVRGLAGVLEDGCTFPPAFPAPSPAEAGDEGAIDPATLRTDLFRRGPVTHKQDLFSQATRALAVAETAARFGLTPEEVDMGMFADLAEEQVLLDPGPPVAPGDLIARYNLELARGILYWAREVRLAVFHPSASSHCR